MLLKISSEVTLQNFNNMDGLRVPNDGRLKIITLIYSFVLKTTKRDTNFKIGWSLSSDGSSPNVDSSFVSVNITIL